MKKTLILSCALALAGVGNLAMAAEGGTGFIRAEVGTSDVEIDVRGFGSASDEDTAATFGGGYWFTPNFAIEGHVGVLYNTTIDADTELDLVTLGVGVAAKKNFGADGNGFFIGGRAGVARLTAQVRETDGFDVIDDESSTKPYYGINAGYDFSSRFGLSLNYDRRTASYDDGVDVDVDTLSLGGEFRF